MWWDWTQITLLDSVLFSLLSLLILYFVGYGFLKLISAVSKGTDPFGSFDFLQKASFRIFFGFGFLLLVVLIFSMLNFPFWISSLLVFALAAVGFLITRRSLKFKLPKFGFKNYAPTVLVFVVLLVVVFLSSMLIVGFYGSTNDDAAYHTFIVRRILDNPNALFTRSTEQYGDFFLSYPSGTHVLCAFFVTLLGGSIQKIVMMVSVILPCLIALAFYSTIKFLFENRILAIMGLIIAAFFTLGISWGPISWGGLPLLLSQYLSITSIGLIFVFLLKKTITVINAFLLGLIFFVASQTYPAALLIITLWFLIILSAKILPKLLNNHRRKLFFPWFIKRNIFVVIVFLIPILFSVPYFYSIYTQSFMGRNFSNIDLSSNVSVGVATSRIGFNWLFDFPALSQFFTVFGGLLAFAPYSLILLIVLFIPQVSQRISSFFPSRTFLQSLLLIYIFMLLIMSYLALTLFLPIKLLVVYFDSERVWQHLFIPGTILTAVVLFSALYFLHVGFKRLFYTMDKPNVVKVNKNKLLACALLVLLIFNVVLLSIPVISDQRVEYNKIGLLFNTFETLGQDDLLLMNWINENVHRQDHILVSAGDSGQFVTPITQRETIHRYSVSRNYTELMKLLTSNASDPRAIPLMIENNVSYVYIGSTATMYALQYPYYRQFNATQFLATPYFTLTKDVGGAFLFQFNASAALAAYDSAGPLPEFVDQWHLPTYIDILASDGGYSNPAAGIYYGSGRLAVYAFANEGYRLDYWMLNGSYLCGPENPVNVDYFNWRIQPVFTKNT